ncbi:Oligosaccharyltransferase 48 kDa subunit beta-domain-containing protein [Armillaria fumosa]|nr:Oligosaccharyltransferase 48 kDa subunit beta-domain-containing protein [Armillaria fumosa]
MWRTLLLKYYRLSQHGYRQRCLMVPQVDVYLVRYDNFVRHHSSKSRLVALIEHQPLIALSPKQTILSSLTAEFALIVPPPGTLLISHLSTANGIPISVTQSPLLTPNTPPVWFSDIPFACGNNPFVVPMILNAPEESFAADSVSSADTLADAAEKTLSSARVTWVGDVNFFNDKKISNLFCDHFLIQPEGGCMGAILKDMHLEFAMLDPHIRTALSLRAGKPAFYSTPDRHDVFKFVIDYKRKGWTDLRHSPTVAVVPPRHDGYPRFLGAAWPYYAGAISTSVGFFLFSVMWLAGEILREKVGRVSQSKAQTSLDTTPKTHFFELYTFRLSRRFKFLDVARLLLELYDMER